MARVAQSPSNVDVLLAKTPNNDKLLKVAKPAILNEVINDTNANIVADADSPLGTLRYDTTNNKLMVKVGASSWQTVTSA